MTHKYSIQEKLISLKINEIEKIINTENFVTKKTKGREKETQRERQRENRKGENLRILLRNIL